MSQQRTVRCFAVSAALCLLSPNGAAIQISDWSNSKTNNQDLTFLASEGELVTFSVATDLPAGKVVWYVNQLETAKTGPQFQWAVASEEVSFCPTGQLATWNIMAEVREPNIAEIGVVPSTFAFRIWTVTTTTIIDVAPGGDIQAAIDSLPPTGGVIELASGAWTFNVAQRVNIVDVTGDGNNLIVSQNPAYVIATTKAAIKIENRANITIRGQGGFGANETRLSWTGVDPSGTVPDVIKVYRSPNVAILGLHIQGGYSGIEFESTCLGLIGGIKAEGADSSPVTFMGHSAPHDPVHDSMIVDSEITRGGGRGGIVVGYDHDAFNITIRNNSIHDNGIMGIKMDSARPELFGGKNYILFNYFDRQDWGIWLYSGSDFNVVRNNHINSGGKSGIEIAMTNNNLIERNVVRNIDGGGGGGYGHAIGLLGAGYEYTFNNVIKHNIIVNSANHGISDAADVPGLPWPSRSANTTIEGNTIIDSALNGIKWNPSNSVVVVNNIVAGSRGVGIDVGTNAHSYNDAWNNLGGDFAGDPGTGDSSNDPLFFDPESSDFHLKSQAGRWDGSGWVLDALTSPAIDAADPATDFSNEPEPNGGRVNMGAYGNTKEASKSAAGPDFSLACNPSTLTVEKGGTAASPCTVRSLVGFSGEVALSCEEVPVGISCVFNPVSVTLAADGSATSELLVEVAASVEGGGYRFDVAGAGAAATRRFAIQLTVRGDAADGGSDGEDGGDRGRDDGGGEDSGDVGTDGRDASDDEADGKDGGGEDRDGRNGAGVTGGCNCGEAGSVGSGVALLTLVIMLSGLIVKKKTGVGRTRNRCLTRR